MLIKNSKLLLCANIFKKRNNILFSNSIREVTSYFSKMNLKEKHSEEYKKSRKEKGQIKEQEESNKEKNLSNLMATPEKTGKNKTWESPVEALEDMKLQPKRSEIEVIQLNVGLNVDVRKGDQNVRGIFKMPGGSIRTPKVCAFVPTEMAEKCLAAGADMIGTIETIKEIQNGQIDFEKCVCIIEMLPMLKNVGRILGPKGLMPNAKIGTACTQDKLEQIIKDLKLGSKEFRVDQRGQIVVPVGKRDFSIDNVLQNIHSFMTVLIEKKPDTIKGRYFLYSFLSSRRLSYKIDMKTLDPKTSTYFMTVINNRNEEKNLNSKATENKINEKIENEINQQNNKSAVESVVKEDNKSGEKDEKEIVKKEKKEKKEKRKPKENNVEVENTDNSKVSDKA